MYKLSVDPALGRDRTVIGKLNKDGDIVWIELPYKPINSYETVRRARVYQSNNQVYGGWHIENYKIVSHQVKKLKWQFFYNTGYYRGRMGVC